MSSAEPPASDARRLIAIRAARGFADGLASVLLATWLERLGLRPWEIGALVTATLLGSAALTLVVGLWGHALPPRALLRGLSGLMVATGIGFFAFHSFWPLLAVAFFGTLNPSAGDVTPFLPTEQALLAGQVRGHQRTSLFARYNLAATFAGALGALTAALPSVLARQHILDASQGERAGFLLYALVGLLVGLAYPGLQIAEAPAASASRGGLQKSRGIVLRLSALFSLDALGGGFVVQSLLALWMFRRFGVSVQTAATFFFLAGLLTALSQLVSSHLAARIGHVRTMVFTHLPANVLLMLAGVVPFPAAAFGLLLLRMSLSSMDVPARQAYVMAMVPPEERAAASSVTNVPRSLASALGPLLAGLLLQRTSFGWPLLVGGALKIAYDLLLFRQFAHMRPVDGA